MNIGDIVNMNFTPQSGHEMAGQHYGVVFSNSRFNDLMPLVFVAPITTKFKPQFEALRVKVETLTPGIHGYICLDHLKSIDPNGRDFTVSIHKLTPNCKKQCRDILKEIMNL